MINSLPTSPLLSTLRALAPCLLLAGCVAESFDPESIEDELLADDPDSRLLDQDLVDAAAPSEASPGFSLQITKSVGDIQLDWADQGPGVSYAVISCPRPYFAPSDPDVSVEASALTGTSVTLTDADDGTTRYFRVVTSQDRLSSTVGKLTIPLEPNFSVLPLCLEGDISDSNTLLTDTGSATVEAAYRWEPQLQTWLAAPVGSSSPLGFGLGMSVGIKHPGAGTPVPSTYTWVGDVPATHELSIPLLVGENNVTMPLNTSPGLMASDILPLITGGQRLGTWDNAALDYRWYPDDGDFAVPPCAPIRLDVSTSSTFPGCEPASLELGAAADHNWYSGGARGAEQGTHGIGLGDCPAGYMVVGLKAYEGGNSDWTDGIGVHCREVTLANGAVSFGAEHYSNWYTGGTRGAEQGTHGGDPGSGDCAPGSVVVGVQYFEGGNSDWVDGIGVHCQQLEWHGGGFTYGDSSYSNWYFGGSRGAEQGTHGTGQGDCAPGQVATGIQYFEGGNSDWVDGVGLRCRELDFDNVCF